MASEEYLRVKEASLHTRVAFVGSQVMTSELCSSSLKSTWEKMPPLKTKSKTTNKTLNPDAPPYVHPVALPSHRGDGPVQASFHLPLDERVTAVDGHNIRPW